MATKSGGSSPFGWVILGFLAGVAATLGAITFLSGDKSETRSAAPLAPTVEESDAAPVAVPVKPRVKKSQEIAASSEVAAPPVQADQQQVADDAAAAGMTTRASPASSAQSQN